MAPALVAFTKRATAIIVKSRLLPEFEHTDDIHESKAPIAVITTSTSSQHRGIYGLWLLCFAVFLGTALTPASADQEYLLGPGDILRITVFKNPDLSLDARVSELGTIGFP